MSEVFVATKRIIKPIMETLQTSSTKSFLADLRGSISKKTFISGSIWQEMFKVIPKKDLSVHGELTKTERAVLNSIQLYAIHQQGNSDPVCLDESQSELFQYFSVNVENGKFYINFDIAKEYSESINKVSNNVSDVTDLINTWLSKCNKSIEGRKSHVYHSNIGESLRKLRLTKDNTVSLDRRFNEMITSDYEGIFVHLRTLIKLLKSQSNIKVDYPQLAEDLYCLQFIESVEKIKFAWSQSYYYQFTKEDNDITRRLGNISSNLKNIKGTVSDQVSQKIEEAIHSLKQAQNEQIKEINNDK